MKYSSTLILLVFTTYFFLSIVSNFENSISWEHAYSFFNASMSRYKFLNLKTVAKAELKRISNNCRYRDSVIIAELYDSTGGENWNVSWSIDDPMEQWTINGDITLDANGCISAIDLPNKNLVGTLPASLGNLSELTYLSLASNKISGDIPNSLGNLLNLEELWLLDNDLSGQIPSELGNLSKLTKLSLAENKLEGTIPVTLGSLSNLNALWLYGNRHLSGVLPKELGNLTDLEILSLGINQFDGQIPESFSNLSQLREFWLSDNNLNGSLPNWLSSFQNLELLDVSYNRFDGSLPPDLGNLPNLTRAYFNNNEFRGCFPSSYQAFCDLNFSTDVNMDGYNFTNNPYLSNEGDFSLFCAAGNIQLITEIDTSICQGEIIEFNGSELSEVGTYRREFLTPDNCDSVVILNLDVNPIYNLFKDTILCFGENSIDNLILQTKMGCDSIIKYRIIDMQNIENVDAGQDQAIFCGNESILDAILPESAVGIWTTNSNSIIDNPNDPKTKVFDLDSGENLLVWTVTYPSCPNISFKDSVILHFEEVSLQVANDTFLYNIMGEAILEGSLIDPNDPIPTQFEIILLDDIEGLTVTSSGNFSYFLTNQSPKQINIKYEVLFTECNKKSNVAIATLFINKSNTTDDPQIITPNGDMKNETFFIPELALYPERYPRNSLVVFNRWGQVVYEAAPYNNDWDGSYKGTSERLPAGTYYYVIKLNLGTREVRYGEVTIIR